MRNLKDKSKEQLAEEFGEAVAEKIAQQIGFSFKENFEYELSIIAESKYFLSICFSTHGYSLIYEISTERKTISREDFVGYLDCKSALELMEIASLNQEKKREKQQALQSSLHLNQQPYR